MWALHVDFDVLLPEKELHHFSWYYTHFPWGNFQWAKVDGLVLFKTSKMVSREFSVDRWKIIEFLTQLFCSQICKFSYLSCIKFITLKREESQGFQFHKEKEIFMAIYTLYEMSNKCCFCRSKMPCKNEDFFSNLGFEDLNEDIASEIIQSLAGLGYMKWNSRAVETKYSCTSVLPPLYLSRIFQASPQPSYSVSLWLWLSCIEGIRKFCAILTLSHFLSVTTVSPIQHPAQQN